MRSCPGLPFFCCIPTCSLLLLHCTSLSQDGLILFKIKKEDWRDKYIVNALSNWDESDQNPCAWNGISCNAFNTVTKVNLTGAFISGSLTSALCGLANLTVLILQDNIFSGPLPNGILLCKRLRQLDLSINKLAGALPSRISELSELKELSLASNDFSGPFPDGLLNCKRLRKLDLWNNKFSGTLPSRISELSELRELKLAFNSFSGSIPPAFGMLPKLESLFLNDTSLNGTLDVLRNSKSLVTFVISNSPLLPGAVPRWLGDSRQLRELGLRNCSLEGEIPDIFGTMTELELLDMSYNHLQGNIPSSLMNLSNLRELRLNNNNLSGQIPTNIDQLKNLSIFDMSYNHLWGNIPNSLIDLPNLGELLLNNNNLSGRIHANLVFIDYALISGIYFNISNNNLSGRIPDALDNEFYMDNVLPNPRLCGGRNLMLPPCSSHSPRRLAIIVVAPLLIIVVALSSIYRFRSSCRKPTERPSWKKTLFISTEVEESYIFRNLKESNVISSGGAGKVYKVIQQNGQAVAVKKIRNRSKPEGNFKRKSEHEECKIREVEVDILGLIRHTNIIKPLCCISSEECDFKLLVYEFMPHGSLFDCMHGDPESEMALQWPMRHKIALGTARGLSYMHHDCSPPILHRDVKTSNILLDGDFEAKIADFGISRVLDRLGDEYIASGYVGSHGYITPEYGHGLKVSEKSDVYSFGVVLLELVSGMKATNEAYGEGVELVQWIRNTITMGDGEAAVLDCRVKEESCIEQMLRVLQIGLVCTNRNPKRRPSMRVVVEMLD